MKDITIKLGDAEHRLLEDRATRAAMTLEEFIIAGALTRAGLSTVVVRVLARVENGKCDADIASELGLTNSQVSDIRRGLGLPANRRYRSVKAS